MLQTYMQSMHARDRKLYTYIRVILNLEALLQEDHSQKAVWNNFNLAILKLFSRRMEGKQFCSLAEWIDTSMLWTSGISFNQFINCMCCIKGYPLTGYPLTHTGYSFKVKNEAKLKYSFADIH